MAFAFPAYHTQTYTSNATSAEKALEEARAALSELKWPVIAENDREVLAIVKYNFLSWGEKFRVSVSDDAPYTVMINSKCSLPTQCFDWGKNKTNTAKYLAALRNHEQRHNNDQ